MSLRREEIFERSVNSIQAIYAVVIALAISSAIQTFARSIADYGYCWDFLFSKRRVVSLDQSPSSI